MLGVQGCELHAVIGAFDLPLVGGFHGGDPPAGCPGNGQDVGQVHLALGVVGADLGQGRTQHGGVEGVDAGVDFVHGQLFGRGVLLLHDSGDRSVFGAQHPAVAGGVGDAGGEDGDGVGVHVVHCHQFAQGGRFQQRHVAVGHHDGAFQRGECVDGFHGGLDGAAGAGNLVLVHDHGAGHQGGNVGGDLVRARGARRRRGCADAVPRAAFRAWPTMEMPPTGWRILGVRDFIRVPAPAARTMTAAGAAPSFGPVPCVSCMLTKRRSYTLSGFGAGAARSAPRGCIPAFRP